MTHAVPLHMLSPGDTAHVAHISGETELRRRLHEMGLAEGQRVEVLQTGSPCILRLNGHKLCLRAEDLLRVLVIREGDAPLDARERRKPA